MSRDSERARAKVNLTLRVLGQRSDGFHEIESLTAFADVCDVVEVTPSTQTSLTLRGPFSSSLASDENLVMRAMRAFNEAFGEMPQFECRVCKAIPVAAGLGGGSADAAAALRLFSRINATDITGADLQSLAEKLGSDVPVCLTSRAAMMRGRGELSEPLETFPALPAVLVNPGVSLKTADVYSALSAEPLNKNGSGDARQTPAFAARKDVVSYMMAHGNDLEPVAVRMEPLVGDVLKKISGSKGCEIARMSGSGPTCFGIFETGACADRAAHALSEENPGWWVRRTLLS